MAVQIIIFSNDFYVQGAADDGEFHYTPITFAYDFTRYGARTLLFLLHLMQFFEWISMLNIIDN